MVESDVTVICIESFKELYGGQTWAGFPGLDTVLPQGLATRLERERKVRIPGAGGTYPPEAKTSAKGSKPGAEKE